MSIEQGNVRPLAEVRDERRPRWGRRAKVAVGLLLLALLLVGGHVLWSAASNRKLTRMVEEYRRRGEPMLPEDFDQPTLSDAENAVADLRASAALINTNDPRAGEWERMSPAPVAPLTESETAILKAAVEVNRAALDRLDAAKPKAGVDWTLGLRTPVIMTLLPDLNPQRGLAQLLSCDALYAHQSGDDARAVRRLRQILSIGRAVDQQPFFVSHLVANGIAAIATQRAWQIAPTLKVAADHPRSAAGPSAPPPPGPAPAPEVQGLIGDLLSYDAGNAGLVRAMRGERMMQLDTVNALLSGKISPQLVFGVSGNSGPSSPIWLPLGTAGGRALKPMMLKDARLMIAYTTDVAAAAAASDWPTFRSRMPAYPSDVKQNQVTHPIAGALLSSGTTGFLMQYRGLAARRLSATALAVRLYAADHNGELPRRLADLVPDYLASVPADPMAVNRPLGYFNGDPAAPAHAGDPVVYSVGDDGADDGGSEQPVSPRRVLDASDPWDRLDIVVHLKQRGRKASAGGPATGPGGPTTQAGLPPVTQPTTGPVAQ